jgi:hypothetical protein
MEDGIVTPYVKRNDRQMNQSLYHTQLVKQLSEFVRTISAQSGALNPEHPFQLWCQRTSGLLEAQPLKLDEITDQVNTLFTHFADLTPLFPRDILFFLGGDCLHYMPDEEIQAYQVLDELRYSAESQGKSFDWETSKQSLKKLQ